MLDKIVKVTEWITAEEVPTMSNPMYKKLLKQYGKFTGPSEPTGNSIHGCYQWAHVDDIEIIGKEVIHERIGYIGTAKRNIVDRTRAVIAPKGAHPIKMILSAGDIDMEDLRVRYVITASDPDSVQAKTGAKLEKFLHNETDKKFGYRYRWVNAQLSNDNKHNYVLKNWRDLTYLQAIKILPDVIEITKQLGAEHIAAEVDQIVNGDSSEEN